MESHDERISTREQTLEISKLRNIHVCQFFQVGKSTTLVKLYQYTGIDPITGLYTVADKIKMESSIM